MENSNDKARNNRGFNKEDQLDKSEVDANSIRENLIASQGSEEQRMKEKYISEVSKIEDAPGDGGTVNRTDKNQNP